jgi:hypothetical protein
MSLTKYPTIVTAPSWTDKDNVKADDASYAETITYNQALTGTHFDFNVPVNSNIHNIAIEIEAKKVPHPATPPGQPAFFRCKIGDLTLPKLSREYISEYLTDSFTQLVISKGNWELSPPLTYSDINSDDFYISVAADTSPTYQSIGLPVYVNYIRVSVTYSSSGLFFVMG